MSVSYFAPKPSFRVAFITLGCYVSEANKLFAKRILDLRRDRGWSQPELGKNIGTSGAIIGRYERGEMTPSIEVARKFAEAFEVSLDYLVIDRDLPPSLRDRTMIERWKELDELGSEDRERILYLVDGLIRDAKARQAYAR